MRHFVVGRKTRERSKPAINIAIALFFCTEFFCYTLPGLGILSFFRIAYISGILSLCLMFYHIFFVGQAKIRNRPLLFLAGLVLVILVFGSIAFHTKCSYEFPTIAINFLLGIILISTNFEIESVLRYILYGTIVVLPGYAVVFAYQWEVLNQANMGAVYSVFTMFAAGVFHFVYYRKSHKKPFYIFYIPTIIAGIGILMYGNRGAILSVFTLVILIVFNNQHSFNSNKKIIDIKKRILFLLFVSLSCYLVLNLDKVFFLAYDIADSIFDELPSFFVKMNKYIKLSDLTNGRSNLNDITMKLIMAKPLMGYGIGTYPFYTGYTYPHNFFLQLWFEGGIFFTIIPTIIVVFACYKLMFVQIRDKELCVTLCMLAVQALPRFLLSSDIWLDRFFWIFIFFVISNFRVLNGASLKNKLRLKSISK